MGRFVRPDTKRLSISNSDWLLVKTRLSWGESRAAFARAYVTDADGTLRHNHLNMGMAQVTAYLLDWSLTDEDGKPVVIRGVSSDELTAALDNLSPEDFTEIRTAIQTHEAATTAEQEEKKRLTAGTPTSEAISPLPSAATGRLSGSVN